MLLEHLRKFGDLKEHDMGLTFMDGEQRNFIPADAEVPLYNFHKEFTVVQYNGVRHGGVREFIGHLVYQFAGRDGIKDPTTDPTCRFFIQECRSVLDNWCRQDGCNKRLIFVKGDCRLFAATIHRLDEYHAASKCNVELITVTKSQFEVVEKAIESCREANQPHTPVTTLYIP